MAKRRTPGKIGEFNLRVYELVALIPEGKVMSYGQIAAYLGNPLAARTVGEAMRNTPDYLQIPCHRVVNKAGTLAPGNVFGGEGVQRAMLEREGVAFKENGRIDMAKCLYRR